LLDCAGDVDQVFVDHRNEGGSVLGCQIAEGLVERFDVVRPVVGWESDSGQQDFDVCVLKCGKHCVEIVARDIRWQAAEAVVAAEFDDHDFRVQAQDGWKARDGVFGCCAAGALVDDFVVIAAGIEFLLQEVGVGMATL